MKHHVSITGGVKIYDINKPNIKSYLVDVPVL